MLRSLLVSLLVPLLAQASDPNARNELGATPLMVAAGLGDLKGVDALLAAGADVFALDSEMGASALHRAAQRGSVPILKRLLARGAFMDLRAAANGHTPLLDALFYQRYEAIDFLLRRGADTGLRNTLGLTVADWARRQKDTRAQKLLDEQRARAEALVKAQWLIRAGRTGDVELARKALVAGQDPNQTARDGNTPLHLACKFGHEEVARLVLEAGGDPNRRDRLMKATPGHKAAFFGHTAILRHLVKHGLEIDARGPYNGYTALHDAVLNGHIETAKVLLEAGASGALRGADGKSSFDLARERGLTELLP